MSIRELINEPYPWSIDGAAAFLRNVILRRSHKPAAQIAADAAPAPEPPIEDSTSWMTTIQPDANAMVEASIEARFFEGVSHAEGQRRLDAYRLQQQIAGKGAAHA